MIKEALNHTFRGLAFILTLVLIFIVASIALAIPGIPIYYFLINYCNYTFAWILGGIISVTLSIFIINIIIAYLEERGK